MSRFYDALKEASRLRFASGSSHNRVGEVVTDDGEGSSGFTEEGELSSKVLTEFTRATGQEAEQECSPDSGRNGTGVLVHALLDRNARLIPQVADTVVVENYRRLRTKLLQANELRPFRSLMIGSANPQEGKSVTAFNLALSFAMLPSYKVLMVDGDLRKASLGKWLAVNGPPGLSDLVEGTATMSEVILKSEGLPIQFVLSGNSKVPPAELLNSSNLKRYFRQMAEQFDIVVVDSPPLNLVTDAQLLASCCDATLLVARAFTTTRKTFEKAVQDLQSCWIVGTILNGGTRAANYRYHGYY